MSFLSDAQQLLGLHSVSSMKNEGVTLGEIDFTELDFTVLGKCDFSIQPNPRDHSKGSVISLKGAEGTTIIIHSEGNVEVLTKDGNGVSDEEITGITQYIKTSDSTVPDITRRKSHVEQTIEDRNRLIQGTAIAFGDIAIASAPIMGGGAEPEEVDEKTVVALDFDNTLGVHTISDDAVRKFLFGDNAGMGMLLAGIADPLEADPNFEEAKTRGTISYAGKTASDHFNKKFAKDKTFKFEDLSSLRSSKMLKNLTKMGYGPNSVRKDEIPADIVLLSTIQDLEVVKQSLRRVRDLGGEVDITSLNNVYFLDRVTAALEIELNEGLHPDRRDKFRFGYIIGHNGTINRGTGGPTEVDLLRNAAYDKYPALLHFRKDCRVILIDDSEKSMGTGHQDVRFIHVHDSTGALPIGTPGALQKIKESNYSVYSEIAQRIAQLAQNIGDEHHDELEGLISNNCDLLNEGWGGGWSGAPNLYDAMLDAARAGNFTVVNHLCDIGDLASSKYDQGESALMLLMENIGGERDEEDEHKFSVALRMIEKGARLFHETGQGVDTKLAAQYVLDKLAKRTEVGSVQLPEEEGLFVQEVGKQIGLEYSSQAEARRDNIDNICQKFAALGNIKYDHDTKPADQALLHAARYDRKDLALSLVNDYSAQLTWSFGGINALHLAIKNDDQDLVFAMMAKGLPLDDVEVTVDNEGFFGGDMAEGTYNPLALAYTFSQTLIVQRIEEIQAEVKVCVEDGGFPKMNDVAKKVIINDFLKLNPKPQIQVTLCNYIQQEFNKKAEAGVETPNFMKQLQAAAQSEEIAATAPNPFQDLIELNILANLHAVIKDAAQGIINAIPEDTHADKKENMIARLTGIQGQIPVRQEEDEYKAAVVNKFELFKDLVDEYLVAKGIRANEAIRTNTVDQYLATSGAKLAGFPPEGNGALNTATIEGSKFYQSVEFDKAARVIQHSWKRYKANGEEAAKLATATTTDLGHDGGTTDGSGTDPATATSPVGVGGDATTVATSDPAHTLRQELLDVYTTITPEGVDSNYSDEQKGTKATVKILGDDYSVALSLSSYRVNLNLLQEGTTGKNIACVEDSKTIKTTGVSPKDIQDILDQEMKKGVLLTALQEAVKAAKREAARKLAGATAPDLGHDGGTTDGSGTDPATATATSPVGVGDGSGAATTAGTAKHKTVEDALIYAFDNFPPSESGVYSNEQKLKEVKFALEGEEYLVTSANEAKKGSEPSYPLLMLGKLGEERPFIAALKRKGKTVTSSGSNRQDPDPWQDLQSRKCPQDTIFNALQEALEAKKEALAAEKAAAAKKLATTTAPDLSTGVGGTTDGSGTVGGGGSHGGGDGATTVATSDPEHTLRQELLDVYTTITPEGVDSNYSDEQKGTTVTVSISDVDYSVALSSESHRINLYKGTTTAENNIACVNTLEAVTTIGVSPGNILDQKVEKGVLLESLQAAIAAKRAALAAEKAAAAKKLATTTAPDLSTGVGGTTDGSGTVGGGGSHGGGDGATTTAPLDSVAAAIDGDDREEVSLPPVVNPAHTLRQELLDVYTTITPGGGNSNYSDEQKGTEATVAISGVDYSVALSLLSYRVNLNLLQEGTTGKNIACVEDSKTIKTTGVSPEDIQEILDQEMKKGSLLTKLEAALQAKKEEAAAKILATTTILGGGAAATATDGLGDGHGTVGGGGGHGDGGLEGSDGGDDGATAKREYTPEEAALIIQTRFRGMQARKEVAQLKAELALDTATTDEPGTGDGEPDADQPGVPPQPTSDGGKPHAGEHGGLAGDGKHDAPKSTSGDGEPDDSPEYDGGFGFGDDEAPAVTAATIQDELINALEKYTGEADGGAYTQEQITFAGVTVKIGDENYYIQPYNEGGLPAIDIRLAAVEGEVDAVEGELINGALFRRHKKNAVGFVVNDLDGNPDMRYRLDEINDNAVAFGIMLAKQCDPNAILGALNNAVQTRKAELEAPAVIMQSVFRGHLARKKLEQDKAARIAAAVADAQTKGLLDNGQLTEKYWESEHGKELLAGAYAMMTVDRYVQGTESSSKSIKGYISDYIKDNGAPLENGHNIKFGSDLEKSQKNITFNEYALPIEGVIKVALAQANTKKENELRASIDALTTKIDDSSDYAENAAETKKLEKLNTALVKIGKIAGEGGEKLAEEMTAAQLAGIYKGGSAKAANGEVIQDEEGKVIKGTDNYYLDFAGIKFKGATIDFAADNIFYANFRGCKFEEAEGKTEAVGGKTDKECEIKGGKENLGTAVFNQRCEGVRAAVEKGGSSDIKATDQGYEMPKNEVYTKQQRGLDSQGLGLKVGGEKYKGGVYAQATSRAQGESKVFEDLLRDPANPQAVDNIVRNYSNRTTTAKSFIFTGKVANRAVSREDAMQEYKERWEAIKAAQLVAAASDGRGTAVDSGDGSKGGALLAEAAGDSALLAAGSASGGGAAEGEKESAAPGYASGGGGDNSARVTDSGLLEGTALEAMRAVVSGAKKSRSLTGSMPMATNMEEVSKASKADAISTVASKPRPRVERGKVTALDNAVNRLSAAISG